MTIMRTCRNCGAEVAQDVRFCQNCGAVMEISETATQLPFKSGSKTILLAGIIGILLMGFGHFYLTRFKRGITILIVSIATGMIFFIAVFGAFFALSLPVAAAVGVLRLGLWLWQTYDARKLANIYNEKLKDTGSPPW